MIHNKYFHILKHYTHDIDMSLYGRRLIDKVPLSPKAIANTLNELENQGILKSRSQGNLKMFSLNKENRIIFDILLLVEIEKKIEFMEKHTKLKHIFGQDNREVGVFGSYAKGIQKKHSDLDIFIIGDKKGPDYEKAGRLYNIEVSIKYFKRDAFISLKLEKNPLIQEIIENHILINGFEKFISLAWGEKLESD